MNEYRAFARTIRGPLVPVLAAFDAQERLDIDSTCRWGDLLISKGLKLFWTTYGTTHYMSLTDREVLDLTEAVAKVIAGRGVFIASVPRQWATNACIEFVEFAARCGAHVVKLQLDWNFSFPGSLLLDHYRRVAKDSPLPLFAYTLGPNGVTSDLLRQIIEIPQFIGMKNDTDDFYGQERYLWTVRQYSNPEEFLVMTGGGLSSVALTYDLGVKAYGDMTPWYSPALSLRLYDCFLRGERGLVNRFLTEIEEPLFFKHWPAIGAGGHWGWGHAIAYHLGLFISHRMRFPSLTLTSEQVEEARIFLDQGAHLTQPD